MNFKEHEENRLSILSALRQLSTFVQEDPDFRGNKAYQGKAIGYQQQFLEDGKYRVVFLGTFNVGKSTAINAFLGGAYLPMDVEECTSKLTFIQRGEELTLVLKLAEAASHHELDALSRLFSSIPASVTAMEDNRRLRITYADTQPALMRRSLEPLVTVMADEEYPHLAPLRDKIEEIGLAMPSSVLEEDIVIVDTPGVHSVSETRQEITYGIIEHSHLVVVLVDSSFAGNVHDLNFIKRIITLRGRRVFFVLNKADKLESDEIDLRGAHGPAHSLTEAFKRHDIPEDSDLFFLSGYRALRAQQLEQGHIALEELLEDNRAAIPTGILKRIEHSETPGHDLAAYLMGQSRLPHLKERLLDYLLNENKACAVIETAARFIWERADDFSVAMENEIKLAKDPARFDELRANRETLMHRLEEIRANAEKVLEGYAKKTRGGVWQETSYPGYEAQLREAMTSEKIQEKVVVPLLQWLREGTHLKDARRQRFQPLMAQMEHEVDQFVSMLMAELYQRIDTVEQELREGIAEQLDQVRELRVHMTEPGKIDLVELQASMTGSYMAFGAGGAALGAATGAAVGSVVPVIGTAIGAGLGGLLGALGGFLARLAWSEDRWIKKLEPMVKDNVMNMLIHGGKDKNGEAAPSILASITEYLQQRIGTFESAVRGEVNNAVDTVQRECDDLLAREEEIRREREAVINRLQPKVDLLHTLKGTAEKNIQEIQGNGVK